MKILILGNNIYASDLIKAAQDRGFYTIVTDNLPADKSPVKAIADEAWGISVLDFDVLEQKCKKEGINAITCGASEVCISANRELCKRLNLPFYASDKGWEITNDKAKFKESRRQCHIPTPVGYSLDINFKQEDLKNISYPVVVKPVDRASSIGLHICDNEEELIAGYKDAYEKSASKKVIVEEFVKGEQVGVIYACMAGKPLAIISGDDCASLTDSTRRVFGASPTKHAALYKSEIENHLEDLFKELEITKGVAGIQCITDGTTIKVLEMNYRLPGGNNPMGHILTNVMLDTAIGQDNKYDVPASPTQLFSYALWLKPGKIGQITGLDDLKNNIENCTIQQIKHEGDEVEKGSGMRQILAFVLFYTDFSKHASVVDKINNSVKVISADGEDMLERFRFENGYAITVEKETN